MPPADLLGLLPHLRRESLGLRAVVVEPGRRIDDVYFPLSGALSLLTTTSSGTTVKVATVGTEGMVGLPVFLGMETSPNLRAISQVPGECAVMAADRFLDKSSAPGALHTLMNRYAATILTQAAQEVACNRLHSSVERASRWLLLTHDRVAGDTFPFTQKFMAEMMGVRRASIAVAAKSLERAGLIRYTRGRITIVDRPALESSTCECYQIIHDASVLPAPA